MRRFNKGFTLIELMVVISIVALLSSVVVAALKDAREKAQNSKITAVIHEYRNALELYRNVNGTYPPLPDNNWRCLGSGYPSGQCGWVSSVTPNVEEPILVNALKSYINQTPPSIEAVNFYDDVFLGVIYICPQLTLTACNDYGLEWMLRGVVKCGNGGIDIPDGTNTLCFIGLQNVAP